MKPKDCLFLIGEIQKSKRLGCFELSVLKSVKIKISRDEDTTKNQDKILLSIYERLTDSPRRRNA
jgi:hypothetical protein